MSLEALQDCWPLDLRLDVKTGRYDPLKVAKRLEGELGEDHASLIEGAPREWERLPLPDGSCKVGIDGGYVRHWGAKQHHFEVRVGKSMLSFGEGAEDRTPSLQRFGVVQTLETHPERRLYEVVHSQNFQMNQESPFLSDGDDTLRARQGEMSPKATPILDWFQRAMQLTVVGQFGKGLVQCEAVVGEAIRDQIERLQWALWHGQVDKALRKIDDLEPSLAPFSELYARFPRLVQALSGVRTYIRNNRCLSPNYGERYRNGEPIATGLVASTVNEGVRKRFGKKQPMQWSKEGAHWLLHTRVRTLNGELSAICQRWYPDRDLEVEEMPVAA